MAYRIKGDVLVARDLTASGSITTGSGSVTSPSYGFLDDLDTGMYLTDSNQVGITAAGADVVVFSNTVTPQAIFNDGTVSLPSIAFAGDNDEGFYRSANNTISFGTGGSERIRLSNEKILHSNLGTVNNPTFGWISDANTGMYSPEADVVSITAGGENVALFTSTGSNPQILANVGSAAAPGLSFRNAENYGMSYGSSLLRWSINGSYTMNLGATYLRPNSDGQASLGLGSVGWSIIYGRTSGGSVGNPTFTWAGDTNTGLYKPGADMVGISAGGAEVVRFVNTGSNPQVLLHSGSAGLPALAFAEDTDTGMFLGNGLEFSVEGTSRWRIATNGDLIPSVDSLYDIGSAFIAPSLVYSSRFLAKGSGTPTVAAYSFSVASDFNTGIYRVAEDVLGITAGGSPIAQFDGAGSVPQALFTSGSLSAPGISFIDDENTGLYRLAEDDIAVTVSGAQLLRFFDKQALFGSGAVASPTISFNADPDTGMFNTGADQLAFVASGSIVAAVTTAGMTFLPSGSASSPVIAWSADTAGIFRAGGDQLSIAAESTEVARFISASIQAQRGTTANPGFSFIGDSTIGVYKDNSNNTDAIGLAANDQSVIFDGESNTFRPFADDSIELGTASFRWSDLFATQTTVGDIVMHDPDEGVDSPFLILREAHETLEVFDVQANKKFVVPLQEVEMTEADQERIDKARRKFYSDN